MVKITKHAAFKEFMEDEEYLEDIFPLRCTPKVSVEFTSGNSQAKKHEYEIVLQWRCNNIGVLDAHTNGANFHQQEQMYEDIPYSINDVMTVFNVYFEKYSTERSFVKMIHASQLGDRHPAILTGRENRYVFKGIRCEVDVVYFDMNKVPYPTPHFGYEERITHAEAEEYKNQIDRLKNSNEELTSKLDKATVDLDKVTRNRNYLRGRLSETKKRMKAAMLELYEKRATVLCGICMSDIACENLLVTNCCHMFCKGCVEQWTASASQNSTTCPECRMKNYLD
jgi:hypothetical protein